MVSAVIDWNQFVVWVFYGLVTCVMSYAVHVLSQMKDAIEKLNINIAVIIERVDNHEKRLDRLEDE